MKMKNTMRFSNRVADYVKYRPSYPVEIISYLQKEYGLTADKLIADIGAGTGISTALFLEAGYQVTAVEPNREMREMSIELLGSWPGFKAVDGTAEQTTLGDNIVDAIIAGQAFHWFDEDKSKTEFKRILRQDGLVALIWNERKTSSPFEKDYEALIIKHGRDYRQVDHRNIDVRHIARFFDPAPFNLQAFPNRQVFDFDGLLGRLLSSSYMPGRSEDGFKSMNDDLQQLFNHYEENGNIFIGYDTKVYAGRLG
jgi:SAM-dependent methyltransferase